MNARIGRRAFLHQAGFAALSVAGIAAAQTSQAQEALAVPNSAGTERPKLKAPPLSCDCHHHIYDAAHFPPSQKGLEPNARVEEYRLLQRRIGTTRDVVVTPRPYGTDNRVTLDAIARLAPHSRGVAVIHPTVTAAELQTLVRGGIRGIRFSLGPNPTSSAVTTLDMIEPLSKRVHELGWHVQLNLDADQIVASADLWPRLPTPIVFDHVGHIPQPLGMKHPSYGIIRKLVDKGNTWIKLSVTYDNSKVGPPTYSDLTKVAQSFVQAAPERMVWGSNWPHPNESPKPDDAILFDLLHDWAPNPATRQRILVENPETLYGFPKSA